MSFQNWINPPSRGVFFLREDGHPVIDVAEVVKHGCTVVIWEAEAAQLMNFQTVDYPGVVGDLSSILSYNGAWSAPGKNWSIHPNRVLLRLIFRDRLHRLPEPFQSHVKWFDLCEALLQPAILRWDERVCFGLDTVETWLPDLPAQVPWLAERIEETDDPVRIAALKLAATSLLVQEALE